MLLKPLLFASLAAAATVPRKQKPTPTTYSSVTIYSPPANYTDPRVLYARNEELSNGDLLATWENYSPEPPPVWFPIYRSSDYGKTWKSLSKIQDTQYGFGLRYQPFLYELPEKIGKFEKGTILASGSAIPTDLGETNIELYASKDKGRTWSFVSHIAHGGEAVPNNGLTPVWEPFLLAHNGKLIVYYSDQRANTTNGQKMVHQTSSDLKNWGPVIDDIVYPTYTDRPGMPIVAKLPNGSFIMTYEYGSFFNTSTYSFPVYYRISDDPEKFNFAPHQKLIVSNGARPTSSPYVVWTSWGGANGTLVVSANSHTSVFINQKLGEGNWTEVPTPEGRSYTRSLRILKEDPTKLLINGAGALPPSTTNKVTISLIDLSQAVGQ